MRRISETVLHSQYQGSGSDAHGNEKESWAAGTNFGIYAFNPGSSSEPMVPGHDRVITKPSIYFPASSIVGARDRFTIRGTVYEADGDPLDFRNPYSSSMDGLSLNLKVVKG